MLGSRPPGLEFPVMCLEGSVILFISPASGGSPQWRIQDLRKGGGSQLPKGGAPNFFDTGPTLKQHWFNVSGEALLALCLIVDDQQISLHVRLFTHAFNNLKIHLFSY